MPIKQCFKNLWRRYCKFYSDYGLYHSRSCQRCIPIIRDDRPLEKNELIQKSKTKNFDSSN